MKAFLLALLLLLGGVARSQQAPYSFSPVPLNPVTHRVVYAGTVAVEDATQAQLFSRAQQWAAQATRLYHGSVRLLRPETGDLQLRGTFRNGQESFGFRLSVHAGNGSYAYQLDQLTYTQPDYAREGKHSRRPVAAPIERLVYTRPGKRRDRKLAELDTHVRKLLAALSGTLQRQPASLLSQL